MAVSLDRFCAIYYPLLYRKHVTEKLTMRVIVVCWVLGNYDLLVPMQSFSKFWICLGLVGFLPLMGWNSGELFHGKCHSRFVLDFDFIIFICTFSSFIPTIVITVVYCSIYMKIIKQVRILD